MRNRLLPSASAALLTAGLVGAAPAVAVADPDTDGSGGAGSGNQVNVPADVKAELCGNSIAALGISEAECEDVSEVLYTAGKDSKGSPETDGSGGVASGNQINVPVDAAVDACGNAVGGISTAKCTKIAEKLAEESDGGSGDSPETDGSGGVASGNQINVPVDAAVDACGNSVAVLGTSEATCTKAVKAVAKESDSDGNGSTAGTDGSGGAGSGNQAQVPVDAAVPICENAVAAVGVAKPDCMDAISEGPEGEKGDAGTDGSGGSNGDKEHSKAPGGSPEGKRSPTPSSSAGTEPPSGAKGGSGPSHADDARPVSEGLPVTGPTLGWLLAAAALALGGGGAAVYVTRRRHARTALPEPTEADPES